MLFYIEYVGRGGANLAGCWWWWWWRWQWGGGEIQHTRLAGSARDVRRVAKDRSRGSCRVASLCLVPRFWGGGHTDAQIHKAQADTDLRRQPRKAVRHWTRESARTAKPGMRGSVDTCGVFLKRLVESVRGKYINPALLRTVKYLPPSAPRGQSYRHARLTYRSRWMCKMRKSTRTPPRGRHKCRLGPRNQACRCCPIERYCCIAGYTCLLYVCYDTYVSSFTFGAERPDKRRQATKRKTAGQRYRES